MTNDIYDKGLAIRKEVVGVDSVERSLRDATEYTAPFQALATEYCWGRVWGRDELDRRARSIANIAMMIALNRAPELRIHIKGALANGVPRKEIAEVILQSAVYCGIPAAGDAFRQMQAAFDEADAGAACAPASPAARRSIAVIGLGAMGYPMAAQLVRAGHDVRPYDANPAVLARFAEEFNTGVAPIASCVAGADFVVTVLPDSTVVTRVLDGDNGSGGVAARIKPGATLIDMTSGDPATTRALAARLGEAGVRMIDAPVSGGFVKARTGELAIMVGGEADTVAAAMDILQAMGTSIAHVGPIGAGHTVKALNNYISAIGWLAVIEAIHTGKRFGLDVATMNRIFNQSSGRNSSTANKVEQAVLSGTYHTGFSLALMAKDVGIAVGLARQMDVDAEVGTLAHRIIQTALEQSEEKDLDNSRLFDILYS
ncbi:NAD(P)-binding domain-containing protein [Bordetella bronchiseptica]|uniref:NAD(P)-binding domain-containing protein n=1 Tax=Bordetella bronchiseptica TaxID=518 RepID=UPI000461014D|nr:NAD(P)-binding domain-containing protein [Bordetella bronchiseptica]KDC34596.1 carboxymuconolactone decarboxylase family protein [Bordetella bronchiseptica M435/02/3]KDC45415.1 carboxymuconolactone decarboxylase family protein [Bordetella bronchiseptica M85/00/2]